MQEGLVIRTTGSWYKVLVDNRQWTVDSTNGQMLPTADYQLPTTAVDCRLRGNYRLRGGLFREFTDAVAQHYGGYENLKTGWVSHIQFEPKVGEQILEDLAAAEPKLKVVKGLRFVCAKKLSRGWEVGFESESGAKKTVRCKILIDGTELGLGQTLLVPAGYGPFEIAGAMDCIAISYRQRGEQA